MRNKHVTRVSSLLFISICLAISISSTAPVMGETTPNSNWRTPDLPFRVLNVTNNGSSLWACGTDEGVAVSSDAGEHWQLKHQAPDGNLLLNIQFAGEKFGYAAGTGGLFLTTEDGGQTWVTHSAGNATILQISFADPQHGIIRIPESLLVTADGGANWSIVQAGDNAEVLKTFPYTFSLAALDAEHMTVMLKQGSAQYEPQTFLVTSDGGKSWHAVNVPNVTLYSFLRTQGKYWAIGTEVIHKDQPGGGYAVPVALYSSDGAQWTHSTTDLSACKPEMCVACTPEGCLSSNGMITNIFAQKPGYRAFPSNPKLTPKWAATESTMCFVGDALHCTAVTGSTQVTAGEGPVPAAVSAGPLGNKASQGPHCIICTLDHLLVDKKVQGTFLINLSLNIARNGIVTAVEATGAPSPEIKSKIEQQAGEWIFEPYTKDGVRVGLRLNTKVPVTVLHPR